MRISDWSSDVCSSDLREISAGFFVSMRRRQRYAGLRRDRGAVRVRAGAFEIPLRGDDAAGVRRHVDACAERHRCTNRDVDRKSVVSGKSVSVRVDLGGRRIIKKKTQTNTSLTQYTI